MGVVAHEQQRFVRPARRDRRADEVQFRVLDYVAGLAAGHTMLA